MVEKKEKENSSAEADHNINVEQQDAPVQDRSERKTDCFCRSRYSEFLRKKPPLDQSFLAKEFPKFIPTGDELIELVKYWIKKGIDSHYWFFLVGQSGGDLLLPARVNNRIAQIEEIVGSEKVQHAIEEAWYEFAKDKDPFLWHVFMYGTKEDWGKVLDHGYLQMEYADCRGPSEGLASNDNPGKKGSGAE